MVPVRNWSVIIDVESDVALAVAVSADEALLRPTLATEQLTDVLGYIEGALSDFRRGDSIVVALRTPTCGVQACSCASKDVALSWLLPLLIEASHVERLRALHARSEAAVAVLFGDRVAPESGLRLKGTPVDHDQASSDDSGQRKRASS